MLKKQMTLRDLVTIALFSAIIGLGSMISIPTPIGIPFTLQTIIIPLTGVFLGAKQGFLATVGYICLGLIGLPVFSNFSSGIGVFLGPTGGFIISFPLMSLIVGFSSKFNNLFFLIGILVANIINFIMGAWLYSVIMQISFFNAIEVVVIPFFIVTIIKIVITFLMGIKIKQIKINN